MNKLKYIAFILISVFFITFTTFYAYAGTVLNIDGEQIYYDASPITLEINGQIIDQSSLPMEPIIIDNTTLVPVREIFENLGAVVDYKNDTREIFIGYNNSLITMTVDEYTYYVNGIAQTFPVPPKIINDKTMIPVRAVSEGMGLIVDWDDTTRTVSVSESDITTTEPEIPEPEIIIPAHDISAYPFIDMPYDNSNVISLSLDTDSITIIFDSPISNISKVLLEDNRLLFDFIDTVNYLDSNYAVPNNAYYSEVRTSQFQSEPTPISRSVIQLNNDVYFSSLLSDDRQTLKILFGDENTEFPTYIESEVSHNTNTDIDTDVDIDIVAPNNDMVSFDSITHSIFLSKQIGISKDDIYVNDLDAFRKNITLEFNDDYSIYTGTTEVATNDIFINTITPNVIDGKTNILITLNQWGTLNVTENDTHIIISFADPHDLYSKIVVIDAGHGGTDVGATGYNMLEKDLNFNVSMKFGDILENTSDIKVYYTRIDDTKLDLAEIGEFASAMGDLLFSVHTNSFSTAIPHGVEVLYLEHDNDDTIGISSEECANIVIENLANDTGLYSRGIKRSNLVIFRNSTIPSVLGEMGFISSPVDAAYLSDDAFLTTVAESYAKSTIEIFETYTPQR